MDTMPNLLTILGSAMIAAQSGAYTPRSHEGYQTYLLAQGVPPCPVKIGPEAPGTDANSEERKCPINPDYVYPILGGIGITGVLLLSGAAVLAVRSYRNRRENNANL